MEASKENKSSLHGLESSDSNQNLRRFLLISLSIHIGVILILFIKSVVLPSIPKEYVPSLRVDLVALPDRKMNDIQVPPASKEEPKVSPKSAEKAKIETKTEKDGDYSVSKKKKKPTKKETEAQQKLKNALARIKALERIKAMQGEQIKGNQVSKGSALSGEAKASLETTYFDVVLERVRSYWELPKWLQEQNLDAKVLVFINRRGEISSFKFIKSSGSAQFDDEVKRTLQASSPFAIPPEGILSDVSTEGVVLGFPL